MMDPGEKAGENNLKRKKKKEKLKEKKNGEKFLHVSVASEMNAF